MQPSRRSRGDLDLGEGGQPVCTRSHSPQRSARESALEPSIGRKRGSSASCASAKAARDRPKCNTRQGVIRLAVDGETPRKECPCTRHSRPGGGDGTDGRFESELLRYAWAAFRIAGHHAGSGSPRSLWSAGSSAIWDGRGNSNCRAEIPADCCPSSRAEGKMRELEWPQPTPDRVGLRVDELQLSHESG